MKYIKAALLFLAIAWSYDTSAQDVKLEVVDAKTIIKGKGERTYRSFLLKVLIHNESPDTVYLLRTGYNKSARAYRGTPRFWSVAGRIDTTHQSLETDVKTPVSPPPPPPSAGGAFYHFISDYLSIPPNDTLTTEIYSKISKLYFPVEGAVYVRAEYHLFAWDVRQVVS